MNKILIFSTLLFGCIFAFIEDAPRVSIAPFLDIKDRIEKFRETLKENDPFNFEEYFLDFDLPELIGNMTMSNITAEEFSKFDLQKADIGITHFDIEVSFATLHVFYNYKGFGLFYQFIPMWGDGISDIILTGASIGVSANVMMTDVNEPITIANTRLQLALKDCTIEITGLLDNPELGKITAEALTDFIKITVNEKPGLINQKVTPVVEKFVNEQLAFYNVTPGLIVGD